MLRLLVALVTNSIILFTRLVTAVQARWIGCEPTQTQRIYFANHASHGDFVLIWTVLPPPLRRRTRPVAGSDYWLIGAVRKFIATAVFRSVLINRQPGRGQDDPIGQMSAVLEEGHSLILFPEGTRNATDAPLLPFKSGIFRLASARPDIELVPVWLANLNRVLPKGQFVPVPLLCTVTFGAPMKLGADEPREAFLARARAALLALAPDDASNADEGP